MYPENGVSAGLGSAYAFWGQGAGTSLNGVGAGKASPQRHPQWVVGGPWPSPLGVAPVPLVTNMPVGDGYRPVPCGSSDATLMFLRPPPPRDAGPRPQSPRWLPCGDAARSGPPGTAFPRGRVAAPAYDSQRTRGTCGQASSEVLRQKRGRVGRVCLFVCFKKKPLRRGTVTYRKIGPLAACHSMNLSAVTESCSQAPLSSSRTFHHSRKRPRPRPQAPAPMAHPWLVPHVLHM